MLILHPIETFTELLWEDFKENKKEWLLFLFWTFPTEMFGEFVMWIFEKLQKRYASKSVL